MNITLSYVISVMSLLSMRNLLKTIYWKSMQFLMMLTGTSVMTVVFNPKTTAYAVGISKKNMDQKYLARSLRMKTGYLKKTFGVWKQCITAHLKK